MFGFAFLMVPLYDAFCKLTGLNGKTSGSISNQTEFVVDNNRIVSIDFFADVSAGFPVNFRPLTKSMVVIPGKHYTVEYLAQNTSDKTIVGQAIPSVAPGLAAAHFKKLECFCFERQTFLPKQVVKMPVRFVIDSELDKAIVDVSMSYKFFRIEQKGENSG